MPEETVKPTIPITNLVLTRKHGERICIGNDVVVEVAQIRGGKVSLKISAPRAVPIAREELRRAA